MQAAWVFDDGETGHAGAGPDRWPWWSFSKTIVAACALRLARDGQLDLDVETQGPWTLRHLLQHRAGVPCYAGLGAYHEAVARRERPWDRERLMSEIPKMPRFAPGAGWAYSNVGYMLAREAVETAAGCDIGALAARYWGAPLDLRSMRLAVHPDDFANVPGAEGYHPGWVYHGCFMGSAADAARMVQALCEDWPEDVLALGGAIEGRPWTETGYGLGTMAGRVGAAGRVVGHSGSGPFSSCAVYQFLDAPRPVSVAVFANGHNEARPEHEATRIAQA